ncbi:MAG: 50S ribosomal protein L22 [Patescibacteria group bacterium]
MKAYLTNYRQSPRKVRIVADLVKGKRVPEALTALRVLVKRAGSPLEKLIRSGVANAKNNSGVLADNLIIKELRVDKGVTLKRSMPRARGSAFPIKKRSSNVMLVLEEKLKKLKSKNVK